MRDIYARGDDYPSETGYSLTRPNDVRWNGDESISWIGVMLCMLMLLLLGLCASYALVPYYEPHRTCYGCW